jgi:tetratricopeptide (TPR) repeat protein
MRHIWIEGRCSRERLSTAAKVGLPELLPPLNAHRRLRGPYTAAGAIVRELVPALLERQPELVHRHDIEVLSASPELRSAIPATRETLTSLAVPEERTRFYSRLRTRRIAHGLAELLRDSAAGEPRRILVIDNVHDADPTDAELIAVLLRRLDPARITLVACSTPEPTGQQELAIALGRYTDKRTAKPDPAEGPARGDEATIAAVYVDGDCTSDEPGLAAAYERLSPAERSVLHDARADVLAALGEPSLHLGAIPFHREHGSDPSGTGAQALRFACDYSIDMGFYDAAIDFGRRGRAVTDWSRQESMWWVFTSKMTTSLAALGRPEEAESLYDEARAASTNPQVHQQAAYATAMLYTRHHQPERLDHRKALAWINEAIAISSLLPDPENQAFNAVFNQNGLALIRVHTGDLPGALRLVDSGLARLNAELDLGKHLLHRSVLLYNRAQVLAGLGQLDEALADYTAVIAADPNYAEYYLDRGNILRRLGHDKEALADYETAIRLSPPFPEVYYNRADMMLEAGDIEAGLCGLDYVLELDPTYLDAYTNRAGARLAAGDAAGARSDVDAGLALDPGNAHLTCVLAQLHADAGLIAQAHSEYDRAVATNPALQAAWAGRAALSHQSGDAAAAVADLDRALDLGDDAALRYNRAVAYRALGRIGEALDDLAVAASLDPDDPDIERERLRCLAEPDAAACG